jgi:hypothetical protein
MAGSNCFGDFVIFIYLCADIFYYKQLNPETMEDKHVISIPQDILAQAQEHIDAAIGILNPYLLPLTPEERHDILKMGNKTLSFVEKARDYAHHYPQLCPSYLDLTKFDTDLADATELRTMHISAKQLSDNVDDTMMVAGSEAFQAALVFYNAVRVAAVQDIPGAKEIYSDLKSRFPGTKRKSEE